MATLDEMTGESRGKRHGLSEFFSAQADLMLAQYRNIDLLLGDTSDYTGPGTHCEVLLRDFLRNSLPSSVSVDKGFIHGRVERDGISAHCPELDILIHLTQNFPPLFRVDDFVIVHPVAVVGMIQVKRTLHTGNLGDAIGNVVTAKRHLIECSTARDSRYAFAAVFGFDDRLVRQDGKVCETFANRLGDFVSDGDRDWLLPDFVGSLNRQYLVYDRREGGIFYDVFDSVEFDRCLALMGLLAEAYRALERIGVISSHLSMPLDAERRPKQRIQVPPKPGAVCASQDEAP